MKIRIPRAVLAAAAGVACVLGAGANRAADAFIFFPVPFGFPIAECGTVVLVNSTFPPDDGTNDCKAWQADSGGAYLVDGIDSLPVGTRVFVNGTICNFCLTTCQAGAILDSSLSACDDGGGGDS
jgi:hypothetical protein